MRCCYCNAPMELIVTGVDCDSIQFKLSKPTRGDSMERRLHTLLMSFWRYMAEGQPEDSAYYKSRDELRYECDTKTYFFKMVIPHDATMESHAHGNFTLSDDLEIELDGYKSHRINL